MKRFALPLLVLILVGLAACSPKKLAVTDAWARPGNAGENGAAYFVIDNPTSQGDTLLSAGSDIAQTAEIHMSMMKDDGTMSMMPQESVPVSAGSKVVFKPAGLHVMLVSLNRDLKPNDSFSLNLNFQNAGKVTVVVEVRTP